MTTFSVTVSNFAIGTVILILGVFLVTWLLASLRDVKRTAKSNRMTFRQIVNFGGMVGVTILAVTLCVCGVLLMTN